VERPAADEEDGNRQDDEKKDKAILYSVEEHGKILSWLMVLKYSL
jgi:hypothetical protein